MIAVIPSIGASPLLVDLLNLLKNADVKTIVVDNYVVRSMAASYVDPGSTTYLWRPGWNIYKTWNFGMRYGALLGENVLILNDDITLCRQGPALMDAELSKGEWAMIGFDYNTAIWQGAENRGVREVRGTTRHGGIGCFAFAVNPRKCGRAHQGFQWWGGDDDLVYHTKSLGQKVGVMLGNPVDHETSTSARKHSNAIPQGWFEHDRQLLKDRWGESW